MSIVALLTLMLLAYAQNIAFSIVSRSRNRNNIQYHLIASIFSNGVWFLTFKYLVTNNMDFIMFIPYCVGTVAGSITGQKLSMIIEKWLHLESDSHLK